MPRPWTYPIVVTSELGGVAVVDDDRKFHRGMPRDLHTKQYVGLTIFDASLKSWRTTGARVVGGRTGLIDSLPFKSRRDIEYDVLQLGSYTLDEIRDHIQRIVDGNPVLWELEVEAPEFKRYIAETTSFGSLSSRIRQFLTGKMQSFPDH
ncbi:MAG: hypothetical protein QM773_11185 [Hyphomonadaceae bacterium]